MTPNQPTQKTTTPHPTNTHQTTGAVREEDHGRHGGLARSGLTDQRRRRGATHPEDDVDGANASVSAPDPAQLTGGRQMTEETKERAS